MRRIRLSTRFRVAAAAALTTAIALGGGAIWFVTALQDNVLVRAGNDADANMMNLADEIDTLDSPTKINTSDLMFGPLFEVVDRAGRPVVGCPPEIAIGFPSLASAVSPDPNSFTDRTIDVYVPRVTGPLATNSPCEIYRGASWKVRVKGTPILNGRYYLYAAGVFDKPAQQVVDNVRLTLTVGVPLVVLLVALVAWFAVRGSLRPVAAIRAQVARITATDLRRRIPVPKTGDELADLATTMNDMLARVSESVDRQHQFVADASHELRTPLTSMRTQLEVLFAHSDRIDWRHATRNVALDVDRMQDLVADLLLLARLEGQAPLPPDSVDLAELLKECLSGRPARSAITICADSPPVVLVGRRGQLARLVGNLLDNAERYAVHTVTVSVGLDGACAVVTVADDGPGIPAADRSRVFDRFVRLDEARSAGAGGSGLGLAIVRDIAVAHGGSVTVADNGPGARFEVRLPMPD